MASVNSSGNGDDALRRARENYQNRESDQAKRHGQQIRQMTETHQQEIQRLKEEHSRQMDELQRKTTELINRKDLEFQRETNGIKELHQKALRRAAVESEDRVNRSETALKNEIERVIKTGAQQRQILKNNYETQLREQDNRFEDYAAGARRAQQQETIETKRRLNQVHQKEVSELVDDRDNRLQEAHNANEELRKNMKDTLKSETRRQANEKDRLVGEHKIAIYGERENHRLAQELQREAFDHGIKRNKERYEAAVEDQRSRMEDARDALSDTVNERLNNQVRGLELSYRKLKEDQSRDRRSNEQKKAMEVQNVKDAMQRNINELERVRAETVDASAKKTREEILRNNEGFEKALSGTNRFYQDKMAMDNLRSNERFMKEKNDHDKVLTQEKLSANARVNKLMSFNQIEEGKLRSFFENTTKQMREGFENTVRELRNRSKQEQETMFAQFNKSSQENEAKFQEELSNVALKYEKQIAIMKEKHQRELKEQQKLAVRQKSEVEKKANTDLKAQESQYQYRLVKLEETQKKEIEALRAQHEEALANLIQVRQS